MITRPSAALSRFPWSVAAAVIGLAALPACRPEYPTCDEDSQCKPGEFCVGRKCQQCRTSTDCPQGSACKDGKCDRIPGYCTDKSQCPPGNECIGNRCRPCAADTECPSGTRCVKGVCAAKPQCATDDDCAQNQDCVDGRCVTEAAPPPPPTECTLAPVYFDFNESALTVDATAVLARNADCLKKVTRPITLVGHADPRGTEEYNLALSERRGVAVKGHIERHGINVDGGRVRVLPRGHLDAKGTDEPSWSQDRRVDFIWR